MMKKAIAFEKIMPTVVSSLMRSSSTLPPRDNSRNGRRRRPRCISSTSCEACQTLAGDPSNLRTDQLDRDHEGEREEDCPQQGVAVLRAGLRVGGNARRVIVSCAGDETRPEQAKDGAPGSVANLVWRFQFGS